MNRMKYILLMLVTVLSLNFALQAETLIDFDFTGLPGNDMGPLTATDSIADHVILADPGLGRGGITGVSASNFTTGEFNWWKFNDADNPGSGWMTCTLEVEAGYALDLSSVTISAWRNGAGAPEDMRFLASTDGVNFSQVGDIIAEPAAGDFTFRYYTFDLSSLPQTGYAELRFSPLPGNATSNGWGNLHINDLVVAGTVVADTAPAVSNLSPNNNAVQIELKPELSWASVNTVSPMYEVNIGTDTNCTDILSGHNAGNSMTYTVLEGSLTWDTTYYWRIDLWEDGIEYPGPVWSFTTSSTPKDYRVIDDFDGYINTNGLKAVWQDGSVNDSSAVITEDLTGAMKLDYDNQSPDWLSKVTRNFSPAEDWAVEDMALLAFTVKGEQVNQGQILSVALDDGTHQTTVEYVDSAIITTDTWTEVYFKINDFSVQGVDLSNIESITIKVGNGQSPGGSGSIYIDDLTLYASRCVPEYRSPADLDGDCQIDMVDLEKLMLYWLAGDSVVTASEPASNHLQACYFFDEITGDIAYDSSVNLHHASVESASWQADGYDTGGCLQLTRDTVVTIPAAVFNPIEQQVTVTFWIKASQDVLTGIYDQVFASSGSVPFEDYTWDTIRWDIEDPGSNNGQWHHCAIVKDSSQSFAVIYWDGILLSMNNTANTVLDGSLAGDTILQPNGVYTFDESACLIDELRIYDAALSQPEIVYLAKGESSFVIQSIYPIASWVDFDNSGEIDLKDYSILAADWLTN
ncbi:MAG: hypothetical protein KAS23_12935 [Anaerohalosphaera sp.]|nr:hypothetical protein [Anaerohalosphaera sp.]